VKKGEPGRKHNLVIARGPLAFQTISGALLLCKPAKKQHSKLKSNLANGEISSCLGESTCVVKYCLWSNSACVLSSCFYYSPLILSRKKRKKKKKTIVLCALSSDNHHFFLIFVSSLLNLSCSTG
jgi:hypothetical protein